MILDGPHILLIDDDIRLRELLHKYLSENNFRVTAADNAIVARRQMKRVYFDLLVLDLMMPGENGLEFAKSIRSTNNLSRDVPILMLTAMGETEDRIGGLEAGSDDYMIKPFEPRELLLRIKSILRRVPREDNLALGKANLGAMVFDPARQELSQGENIVGLTSGESNLLKILAERPGVVFSREDLSNYLALDSGERAIDVQVIGSSGNNLGTLPLNKAIQIAKEEGLDLIEISPNANPPVCKTSPCLFHHF